MSDTIVKCKICGTVLGDYMSDDYFKLISMKYCPKCRELATRERKRDWERKRRKQKKEEKKEIDTQLDLLKRENKLLREYLKKLGKLI